MSPVTQFLQEKYGGAFASTKHVPRMFGDALAMGVVGAGAAATLAGAGMAATHLYDAATKGRDFRRMMEVNPDLVSEHEKDPKSFNQLFSSLRTVNTSFSRDPIIAGTYMRRMVGSPAAGGVLTDALGFLNKKETGTFGGTVLQSSLAGAKPKLPSEKPQRVENRRPLRGSR